MRKFLTWALLIYAVLGIAIYYAQGYFFFRSVPLKETHRYSFSIPYREVNLPFKADANLNIIQFETQQSIRGVVLYLHGNSSSRYEGFAQLQLLPAEVGLACFDFNGCGNRV
jgi:hypothetical protein